MKGSPHVLIIDDEEDIRRMLRSYLVKEGFRVSEAAEAAAAYAVLEREAVDIVLLDWMMPGEDGIAVARHIRQRSEIPIIMLTGKGDVIDRVVGLETGADDYLAKPFHLREVLARIRTVLRRSRGMAPSVSPDGAREAGDVLIFEGWQLDLLRRELRRPDGASVPLTTGEFELLRALAGNANRVLSRDQLSARIKGRSSVALSRAVDAQVVRLRRKIEQDPAHPALIRTVHGAGYVFAATVTRG